MRKLRVKIILLIQVVLMASTLAQVDFTADVTQGCSPLAVKFSIDLSTVDIDTVSSAEWYVGIQDSVITGIDPDTFAYELGGRYSVTLVINGYMEDAVEKTDYINVHQTVSSTFTYEEYAPNHNYRFIPLDDRIDLTATYFYMWRYVKEYDGTQISHDKIITFVNLPEAVDSVVLDTGMYDVTLRIEDTYGCLSRSTQQVIITDEIRIPNIFTPGNEEFFIINPQNMETVLKFQVFNRYGVLVFSQTAPIINWNGKTNTNQYVTTGVYFYVLESVEGDPMGLYDKQGFIHIYR
jgi:gliding motility-associated-like protein